MEEIRHMSEMGRTAGCSDLSRRQFLRHSSVVAGAALVLPARIFGGDGGVAPSNRITIGFIGTGRQCIYANIPGFLREPDAQCVAVCDVDAWRMARAKEKIEAHYAQRSSAAGFKGCATFSDWRELIERKDIDAVMISTPDHWHMIQAIAALKAGKDVACEKPLTRNIAEGRKLCETVIQEKRVFRTDSEFRSNKSCHRAAELARNGKIGRLQRLITGTPKDSTLAPPPEMPVPPELDYEMWLGPAPRKPYTEKRVHPRQDDRGRPGWLTIRDYADGMLANWGAHLNDIVLWGAALDETGPVEIEAAGKFPPPGSFWDVIQEFEAHFTYANGLRLTCKTDKPYMRFEGTEGWIQVNYPTEIEVSDEALLSWKPGPNDVRLPFKASEKRDFLDAVKSRTQPLYTAEGGHRNASLSHLALAAIELGRRLKWDPVKEVVLGDEAANRLLQPKPMRAPWKI